LCSVSEVLILYNSATEARQEMSFLGRQWTGWGVQIKLILPKQIERMLGWFSSLPNCGLVTFWSEHKSHKNKYILGKLSNCQL
jgi:hypothetical protein